jgi:parallel beta-helix repeat protein
MRKISFVVMSVLVCLGTFLTFAPPFAEPVEAWAVSHGEMTNDALLGLAGFSYLDIMEISAWSLKTDIDFPDAESGYYHRVREARERFGQGDYAGAEKVAADFLEQARFFYARGYKTEGNIRLGYAIHFIQDAVSPSHVFPFRIGDVGPHTIFEFVYTDGNYDKPLMFIPWRLPVMTAPAKQIWGPADLRNKMVEAADQVNRLSCDFQAQDGKSYSADSGVYTEIDEDTLPLSHYRISDDDIGTAMELAAALVKGAAIWAKQPGLPVEVGQGAPNPQLFIDCYTDTESQLYMAPGYDEDGGSILGDPIGPAEERGNGWTQSFRGGDGNEGAIMKPNSDNYAYAVYGAILSRYRTLGGASGSLGYPLGSERSIPYHSSRSGAECRYNNFEGGSIVHHATGPRAGLTVFLGHGIYNKWQELDSASSDLGLPISDESDVLESGGGFYTTGKVCDFEGGHIYWYQDKVGDKAFETYGPIDTAFIGRGGPASSLGFPISDQYEDLEGNQRSDFQGGFIGVSSTGEISVKEYGDSMAPNTEITGGPGPIVAYNRVTFTWSGSDQDSPSSQLVYSYYLQNHDSGWSDWAENTTKQYVDLPNGDYTFRVRAKDTSENIDPTPDQKDFSVFPLEGTIFVDDDFVDDPATHQWDTIQEGLSHATSGDKVIVYSGIYVVHQVTVPQGITLTIEPGAVVKFQSTSSYLHVDGSLIAEGSPGQEIIFTSLKDDIAGGEDTNGDGTATLPAPGNWQYLYFDSASGIMLDHVVVRYAQTGIWSYSPDLVATHSTVTQCSQDGILIYSGSSTITGNTIGNNGSHGINVISTTSSVITGNTISGNADWAISLGDPNVSGNVSGNTISGPKAGVWVKDGTTITSNVTWNADAPYVVYSHSGYHLTVAQGATLTIEPGAIVKFEQGGYLHVDGSLVADGTADQPIIFTSVKDDIAGGDTNGDGNATSPAPGDWQYLGFDPTSSGMLDQVVVRYAQTGIRSYSPDLAVSHSTVTQCSQGGIFIYSGSSTITGNTISNNGSHGIYVDSTTSPVITENTISGNADWAICLRNPNATKYVSGNTISGPKAGMWVRHGTITSNVNWNADAPYVVEQASGNYVTVAPGVTLTIEPGAIVKFEVMGSLHVDGSLIAEGSPGQEIIFTSVKDDIAGGDTNGDGNATSPAPGDWQCLGFDPTSSGMLDQVMVRYAQSGIRSYSPDLAVSHSTVTQCSQGGIFIYSGSSTITGNTISNNGSHGIYVDSTTSPVITENTISGNADWAINLRNPNATKYVSGNIISGPKAGMWVNDGAITSNVTWNADAPYVVDSHSGTHLTVVATLTIEPGAIVKFEQGGYLHVVGSLVTEGSPGQEIIFTSLKDDIAGGDTNGDGTATSAVPGDWQYLGFDPTSSGMLDQVVVRYAQTGIRSYSPDLAVSHSTVTQCSQGGIYIYSGSSTITGNTISSNGSYGIYVFSTTSSVITGNTISGNADWAISLFDPNATKYVSGNTISGPKAGMWVNDGAITSNVTWNADAPYVVDSHSGTHLTVVATLTIEPGAIVKFEQGGYLHVVGSLVTEGSPGQEIIFTSLKDDIAGGDTNGDGTATSAVPGDWQYLGFDPTSSGMLDQVVVRYAQTGIYSQAMDLVLSHSTVTQCSGTGIQLSSGSGTVTGNTISGNGSYGISLGSCQAAITGNTIRGNSSYGIYASGSGSRTVTGNKIVGNSGYGIYNSSTSVILSAENNWWGDNTGPLDNSDDRSTGGWYNPLGLGDKVSNFVDYEPWLTSTVPSQPANIFPSEGSVGVTLEPTLRSSAFSAADTEDTHTASEWQVSSSAGDYSSPVFESGTDNVNLTQITIPSLVLSNGTTYYWQVRYQDNHEAWSDWSAETSFRTDEVVTFSDANLEGAVREAIGKPDGDIYVSDLVGLTVLDATYRGITSLAGLEYCTHLTELYLDHNQIGDITVIQNLPDLTDLSLDYNQIGDISALAGLSRLRVLNLEGNQVHSIAALSGALALEELYLSLNNITDIFALSDLPNLDILALYGNQVSDIAPLVDNLGLSSGDIVVLMGNPLSSASIDMHIPELQARGVTVVFPISPAVTTNAASDMGTDNATLNGELTSLGTAPWVDVCFQWGLTTSYGNTTTPQVMSATGVFSADLSPLPPGTYHFRARAVGDGVAYGDDMTFTINAPPVANDDSHSVDEGAVLAVPAPGVLSNDTDADSDTLAAGIVTGPIHGDLVLNADGSFTYTPEAGFTGAYSFTYAAYDGAAWSNTATVTITVNDVIPPVPSLVSPANWKKINSSYILDWSDVSDPSGVTYQIRLYNSSWVLLQEKTGLTSSAYAVSSFGSLADGTYYWRVRAVDGAGNASAWTTSWAFKLDNTLPSMPVHLSPTSWKQVNSSATLDWSDVSDPSGVTYQIRLYNSSWSLVKEKTGLTSSACAMSSFGSLADGTYYWRVRAVDGAGNASAWTTSWAFKLDNTLPSVPVHLSPTSWKKINSSATLDWSDVSDASGVTYQIRLYNSSWALVKDKSGLTSSAYAVGSFGSLANGTYYWKVRAVDGAGNASAWTTSWAFKLDSTVP